jgi:hypothetical protein
VPYCLYTVLLRFSMWLMLCCFLYMLCLIILCSVFVHFLGSSSLASYSGVLEDVFCFVRILCVLFCLWVYTVFLCLSKNGPHIRVIVYWGFSCLRKYITYEDIF